MADNGAVIDKLSIEIGSDISGAEKGLERLKKTLDTLKSIYSSVGDSAGDVSSKLKDLASGLNAFSSVDSSRVDAAVNSMKKLAKIDFSGLASIPSGVADGIVAIADGVNLFSMQIDGKMLTRSLSALKKLREFDFQGLSMNIDNLDPAIAQKVRAFMQSFEGISGSFALTDSLESMRQLFSMDFSNFTQFMATAESGLPGLAQGITSFASACGTPEFDSAIEKLSRLANVDLGGLAQLSNSNFKVVPDVSEQVEKETVETQTAIEKLKSVISGTSSSLGAGFGFAFSALKFTAKPAIGAVKAGFNSLKSTVDKATKGIGKFTRSIGRIAMYRSIRFLFSQIAKGFKEGTDNLYQYSKAIDGQFAKSMDMLSTALLYFRNSVAAAAAPTINKLAPAIDYLVDRVVECLNWFNELTAKLTGASTWTKALKYPKEYAESTKDATKAMKDFQMGFDELNVISDTSAGKEKDGLDYSKMFTEMKVEAGFEPWADSFREALEKSDFYGAGVILGNKVKDTFKNLPSDEWGSALAEKLNNAIDLADGFLSTHPFDEMGMSIARFLNSTLGDLNWHGLAETFSNGLNSILTGIDSFLIEFEAYDIAHKIGEGLSGFDLAETLSNAGHVIHDFLNDVLDGANGLLEGVEWDKLGGDLFKGLSDFIFGNDWVETGGKAVEVIKNLGNALVDFAGGIGGEIVLNLFDDEQLDTWTSGAEEITGHIDSIKSSYQDFKTAVEEKGGIFNFLQGWGAYVYDEFHKGSEGASEFSNEAGNAFDGVTIDSELWQESFNETMDKYVGNWQAGVEDIKTFLTNLANNFKSNFDNIKNKVSDIMTNVKSNITTKLTEIKNSFSEKVGNIKENWSDGFNEIKSKVETKFEEMKTFFSEWDGLDKFKENVEKVTSWLGDTFAQAWQNVIDVFSKGGTAFDGITQGISEVFTSVVNSLIDGINNAISVPFWNISEAIRVIREWDMGGFRPFEFLPVIDIPKLPRIEQYARGGYPDSGEIFMANENGVAEMVGRIGSRTAVANNEQIVDAMSDGVSAVLAEYIPQIIAAIQSGKNTTLNVDGRVLARAVNKANRESGVSIFGGSVVNA